MTDVGGSLVVHLLFQAGLGRGATVVEFGSGAGALCRLLAREVGPDGRVLGLDPSAFSVARARELSAQERLENLSFEVADLGDTHLPWDCADVCLARESLGSVSSPERITREMTRIVRPSGVIAAFESDEGLVVYEPEPPALAELRDLLARERLAGGGRPISGRSLYRLLSQAGLADVRVVALTSNSTELEWSKTRDPANHTALLLQAVDRLVEKGTLSKEEGARYGRALDEITGNPLSFVFVCGFFAYGRRPLRCA